MEEIDRKSLQMIKSYKAPPPLVMLVLSAVCLLFRVKETWEDAKRYLLGDMHFLQKLIEFDVRNAEESLFIKLRKKYFSQEFFQYDLVKKQS